MLETIRRRVRPNRDLGQNFLTSAAVLDREVETAGVTPADVVLEVGPGIGTLTERLLRRAARVVVIEADPQFRPILDELGAEHGNLEVIWGDAVTVEYPPFDRMVANLPYKVSLPLIFRLLDAPFVEAALIIQQRLARRLSARPGEQGYSRISVAASLKASIRYVQTVDAADFHPAPEVDSALIHLRRRERPSGVDDFEAFGRMLDVLFLQRGAPIETALGYLAGDAAGVRKALSRVPKLRHNVVESTTPLELARLYRELTARGVAFPVVPDEVKRKSQKYFG